MVLIAAACVLVGRELVKLLPKFGKKTSSVKRAAQSLAIALREVGLRKLPEVLEELVVGDVPSLLENIQSLAKLVHEGHDTILKELDGTFNRVLEAKLRTPEGRAVIKARVEEIEQTLLRVAVAAAPVATKVSGQAALTAAVALV